MRILVCGSRTVRDRDLVFRVLDELRDVNGVDSVIEGCARGPDIFAEAWAGERGIAVEHFPADWDAHGKAAGHIRNAAMLRERPDLVVAFWDGRSSGTAGTIKGAEKLGLSVVVVPA